MFIKTEWLIIGLIGLFVAYNWYEDYRKQQAVTYTDNDEKWVWTDYRGFKHEIEVSRHVH